MNEEQKKILDGKEGEILQQSMVDLVNYGTAMGAEEFIPITSVHTSFSSMNKVAHRFPPRRVQLTEKDIAELCEIPA